jgi:hypothetical protein
MEPPFTYVCVTLCVPLNVILQSEVLIMLEIVGYAVLYYSYFEAFKNNKIVFK